MGLRRQRMRLSLEFLELGLPRPPRRYAGPWRCHLVPGSFFGHGLLSESLPFVTVAVCRDHSFVAVSDPLIARDQVIKDSERLRYQQVRPVKRADVCPEHSRVPARYRGRLGSMVTSDLVGPVVARDPYD